MYYIPIELADKRAFHLEVRPDDNYTWTPVVCVKQATGQQIRFTHIHFFRNSHFLFRNILQKLNVVPLTIFGNALR